MKREGVGKENVGTALSVKCSSLRILITMQVVYYRPGLAKKGTRSEEFCLSVFYLLQCCIRDPLTQRKGFLFICDLRGTKLLQVDRKLVKSIVGM